MSRPLDDVALREIFKSVDAATLQACRRVSKSWNSEIQRLAKYTSKFRHTSLIMEIHGTEFRMMLGTPGRRESFTHPLTSSDSIRRALRHVHPPRILLVFLNLETNAEAFARMMDGIESKWSQGIEELEIFSRNNEVPVSEVLAHLEKFPGLLSFSITYDVTDEKISCSEIFRRLSSLRFLRINGSEENTDTSSGLVFDNDAVECLLKNQNDFRNIQTIELFNTNVSVSAEMMTKAFQKLAALKVNPSMQSAKNCDESSEVHLLFHRCQWDSVRETSLLSLIRTMSPDVTLPILPNDEDDVLMGDFRFSVAQTDFVLKFIAGKTFF